VPLNLTEIPTTPFAAAPSNDPDPLTATCIADSKLNKANLINRGIRDDLDARKKYANRAFWIVACWLMAILAIIFLQGFFGHMPLTVSITGCGVTLSASNPMFFFLSDSVLIALIGGTTASVIGILGFVMKYLFPTRGNRST
jgi:hypothetical protein